MTTEKTDQGKEPEEKGAGFGCCSPEKFAEMMAKCGPDMKGGRCTMMQEMMKKGCSRPEQK